MEIAAAFLFGCTLGAVSSLHWAFDRFLKRPVDPLGAGIREQMARVKHNKRFVDDDHLVTSHAVIETIDGTFEVLVRQPAPEDAA